MHVTPLINAIAALGKMVLESPFIWSFEEKNVLMYAPTYAAFGKVVLKSRTIWSFEEKIVLMYAPTYAALGEMVVKRKYVLAVVKALDVVARGSVVRAPMRGRFCSDEHFSGGLSELECSVM